MSFHSILFASTEDSIKEETLEAPVFFGDLYLDQIIDAITANKQEYNLQPFFYTPLHDIDAVKYRHEVMQDLENTALFEHIQSFAHNMRTMREYLAQADKLYYKYQKERWFLDAVAIYCDTMHRLVHALSHVEIRSRGFVAFRDYVTHYAASERFTTLLAATHRLQADLSTVTYCVLIKDNGIKVRTYASEIDYSAAVEETFAKFKQAAVRDYKVIFVGCEATPDHCTASMCAMPSHSQP